MSSRTRLIEIVGVAGAGKSTLTHSLERRYGWQIADFLHTRAHGHWPYVAHSLPSVLGIVARSTTNRPALSWDEVKLAVYVSEWNRFLRSRPITSPASWCSTRGRSSRSPACSGARSRSRGQPHSHVWLVRDGRSLVGRARRARPCSRAPDRCAPRPDRQPGAAPRRQGPRRSATPSISLDGHRAAYVEAARGSSHIRGRPPVLRFDTVALRSATEVADEIAPLFGGGTGTDG